MGLAKWWSEMFPPMDPYPGAATVRMVAEHLIEKRQKPHLAAVRNAPSREDFDAWRDDPTTLFVTAALKRNAEECEQQWMRASWEGGKADQDLLIALRERSDALMGFTGDYEDFCAVLGLDPEPVEEE